MSTMLYLMAVSLNALSAIHMILMLIELEVSFSMSGSMIDNVDSWLHLGYNISNNGSDKVAISNCPSSFIGQDNYAICWFNVLDCDIQTQLLKIIVQVCMIVNLTVWL